MTAAKFHQHGYFYASGLDNPLVPVGFQLVGQDNEIKSGGKALTLALGHSVRVRLWWEKSGDLIAGRDLFFCDNGGTEFTLHTNCRVFYTLEGMLMIGWSSAQQVENPEQVTETAEMIRLLAERKEPEPVRKAKEAALALDRYLESKLSDEAIERALKDSKMSPDGFVVGGKEWEPVYYKRCYQAFRDSILGRPVTNPNTPAKKA